MVEQPVDGGGGQGLGHDRVEPNWGSHRFVLCAGLYGAGGEGRALSASRSLTSSAWRWKLRRCLISSSGRKGCVGRAPATSCCGVPAGRLGSGGCRAAGVSV